MRADRETANNSEDDENYEGGGEVNEIDENREK